MYVRMYRDFINCILVMSKAVGTWLCKVSGHVDIHKFLNE